MQALNVDLARYDALVSESEAFDALVENAMTEIIEETEFLYRRMITHEKDLSEIAQKAIREFAYKKAFFDVVRKHQEDLMGMEYMKFIRKMNEEFISEMKSIHE